MQSIALSDRAGSGRPTPPTEAERLRRLRQYHILETPPEASFDEIARLAATVINSSIALLCIADESCHWTKASVGIDLPFLRRDVSFCDHTLASGQIFVVLDATADPRFADNPYVVGPPHLRFYLGCPLTDAEGYQIGTICCLDSSPRTEVLQSQLDAIASLARITVDRLELRRRSVVLAKAQKKAEAAEAVARAAHARLREAIDILPEAIVFMDAEKRLELWNRRYSELFPDVVKPWRPEPPTGGNAADIGPQLDRPTPPAAAVREQRFENGRWFRYDERQTADGGTIGIRVDITELKQRETSIKLLFDRNPVPLWLCDAETLRVIAVNDATLHLYGYSRAEALAMALPDICIGCPDVMRSEIDLQATTDGHAAPRPQRHRRAFGTPIDVLPFIRTIDFEDRPALLFGVVDITERLRAEARIKHLAHHDPLTDLPNRALFQDRLAEAIAQAKGEGSQVALCLVDLDRFKIINDTLGHAAGDAVLRVVARRLARLAGPTDMVARLGGDEFALVVAGSGRDPATVLAEVPRIFDDPIICNGEIIQISGSAGAAIVPEDGTEPVTLMQNADVALYASKAEGRNRLTLFDQNMRAKLVRLNTLTVRFRQALRDGELVPHYQPVVNLSHFTIRGYEALLRWNHPQEGLLTAADFAEVFDIPELAVAIGRYMLDAVTRDMRAWLDAGIDFGCVAVNVTAADLKSEGFAERVLDTLATRGIPPNRLIIEATENSLVEQDNVAVAKVLDTLDAEGVYIALDDFGTGHSSLVHLRQFNIATLKIDRSFVRDMTTDREDAAIVHGVTMLARSLGIATVAEGIETEEQAQMLVESGCSYGQGYLFGRPIAADQVGYFSAHRRLPALSTIQSVA